MRFIVRIHEQGAELRIQRPESTCCQKTLDAVPAFRSLVSKCDSRSVTIYSDYTAFQLHTIYLDGHFLAGLQIAVGPVHIETTELRSLV
jgi:hypothetical protein